MDTTTAQHSSNVAELVRWQSEKLESEKNSDRTLRGLISTLQKEAEKAYKTAKYDQALEAFSKLLAVVESRGKPTFWRTYVIGDSVDDMETRASCLANIGSCCHQMGEHESAKSYYEQAISAFDAISTSRVTWLFYGDVNEKRCNYIRKRLLDLADAKQPPRANYLDGTGKERKWSARELAGGETYYLVDWVNPISWYSWATTPTPTLASGDGQQTNQRELA